MRRKIYNELLKWKNEWGGKFYSKQLFPKWLFLKMSDLISYEILR